MASQNSIRTNPSSLVALQNVNRVDRTNDSVQTRVSSGMKVSGALDDASNFAVSQGIRTDIRAWQAVKQSLNNSLGIVKVATAGTESVSQLMAELKKKAVEYHNATGVQQEILLDDYTTMLGQIDQIAEQSSFNGRNLIGSPGIEITDPPDEGTNQFVTSSGAPNRTHTLPAYEGIINLSYSYSGFGSTISLVYNGTSQDSVTYGLTTGTATGALSFTYTADAGTDFTVSMTGLGNTFYSFTYTPTATDTATDPYSALADTQGRTIEVNNRSMRTEDLGLRPPDLSNVNATIAQVDTANALVGEALGYFGAKAKQLTQARDQAGRFADAHEEGLGNIVDADLAREAARLQSSQVQQQLSLQTLGIANARPQSLLTLFR